MNPLNYQPTILPALMVFIGKIRLSYFLELKQPPKPRLLLALESKIMKDIKKFGISDDTSNPLRLQVQHVSKYVYLGYAL